jgi:pSer/pThr/pTyr-binding forkhead associated (FHA) protein
MQDPAHKASPAASLRPGAGRSYVLRFISGKYQGGEFPIVNDKPIIVGRSSDLDMVLVEDMVSRKHARITMQADQIWIEDLGSTNGTFVNGEKIKRARLKEGDRVLIGTSILKVIAGEGGARADSTDQAKEKLERVAQNRPTQARTMSGSIEEVPLPDLLQLFATSKKNGVLVVRTETDDVGKIYLKKGVIYFATINDLDDVPPMKSIFRMLTWQKGLFDLEPPDEREFPNEINVSVQEVLMEGLRQLDEFNEIRNELPDLNTRLMLSQPVIPPLRDLKPEELDILQLAHNYGHLETVLNKSLATDLETVQSILKLIKGAFLRPE